MILVKPSFEIMEIMGSDYLNLIQYKPLHLIEKAGRTCYKSEDKITGNSAEKFVKMVRDRGHHSVIEHSAITVKFIIDRGVSHELVRHRLCAFSQESTRYCNYRGGVTFVIPPWLTLSPGSYTAMADYQIKTGSYGACEYGLVEWFNALIYLETVYIQLLSRSWTPQQARSVLPNSLKTEIVVTANFREWMHILTLRTSKAAHPQMREIMIPLLKKLKELIPVIFEDIE